MLEHSIVIGVGFILNHRKATASSYYYRDIDCLWFSAKNVLSSLHIVWHAGSFEHISIKKNSYFASKSNELYMFNTGDVAMA